MQNQCWVGTPPGREQSSGSKNCSSFCSVHTRLCKGSFLSLGQTMPYPSTRGSQPSTLTLLPQLDTWVSARTSRPTWETGQR